MLLLIVKVLINKKSDLSFKFEKSNVILETSPIVPFMCYNLFDLKHFPENVSKLTFVHSSLYGQKFNDKEFSPFCINKIYNTPVQNFYLFADSEPLPKSWNPSPTFSWAAVTVP